MERVVRIAAISILLILAVGIATGCATWRGARLYETGSAALERGDVERAVTDLERAAALVPRASEVQNHLGLAYSAAGRDADALAAFERAVALDCENEAAAQNLRVAERRREAGGR